MVAVAVAVAVVVVLLLVVVILFVVVSVVAFSNSFSGTSKSESPYRRSASWSIPLSLRQKVSIVVSQGSRSLETERSHRSRDSM